MKRLAIAKIFLFGVMMLLILSVVFAVVSLYPVATGDGETRVIINDSFRLTPLETRRQGLGSFHGGENVSLVIHSESDLPFNFSVLTYTGTNFSNVSTGDVKYTFTAGADYYEAVFFTDSKTANEIHFEASIQELKVLFPFSWLTNPAKVLFFSSLGAILLLMLKSAFNESSASIANEKPIPILGKKSRRRLMILLLLSLSLWFTLLAVNANPLATFENWYTDHARNPYSASLFLKVGFSVFDTPLGKLASNDSSFYKFVTWPEMPHLYPIGSIFLFAPFGFLLQNGVDQIFVFKIEMVLFLLFSHVGLYYFLKHFWKKEQNLPLKLLGVYIMYVALIVYSANGMFDAVAFLFSLIALTMYLAGRFANFLLFVAVAVTLKYQAVIFLFPLIAIALMKLFEQHGFLGAIKNKAVAVAAVLAVADAVTVFFSAPFLIEIRPELVMNGVNAFSPHSQIPWGLQSFAVLLTLAVTLIFSIFMLHKNSLISLSAIISLMPIFTMPYFQPWYLPFFFVYALVPKEKKMMEATMLWLVFMIAVLSFGGVSFSPFQILDNLRKLLKL